MRSRAWFAALLLAPAALAAQGTPAAQAATPPLPPATKLEGFRPKAGSIVIKGYDELGRIGTVSVDVRENRDLNGTAVRGLVVEVRQSEYRIERALVDADEIPELLRGLDALLDVQKNPTKFENFEVQYETKGALKIVAFNNSAGKLSYVVKTGRLTEASAYNLDVKDLRKLREMFVAAQTKLAGL